VGRVSLPEVSEAPLPLDLLALGSEVVADYRSVGFTSRPHPLAFLREELARARYLPCADLHDVPSGRHVSVAGLVLVRQKPGSAKGVMFITLEDETAVANLIVWPSLFEKQRRLVLSAGMMGVQGKVQLWISVQSGPTRFGRLST
jgi:error-prone DNA polymerase